ncbi:MAG: hypothetical protein JTT15_04560 [Candidatus Brockarchaeota archaeon]|nr:hypothetical protein [Candidatus Brockarchaeota archaeon]
MDEFEIKIVSEGEELGRFIVKRGFSPRVFHALSNLLPKVGVVSIGNTYVCLNIGLKMGVEKFATDASMGDVGYSPYFQGLVFFTSASSEECRLIRTALIGRMLTPVERLKSLKDGAVVSVLRC